MLINLYINAELYIMQLYMIIIHTMKHVMRSKRIETASPSEMIHAGEAGRSEACKISFDHRIYRKLVNTHPEGAPASFA